MTPAATGDARAIALIESILRARGAIAPELLDARTLESLARARCAAAAADSLEAYARVLQSDPREADRLIGEIAVPETWFFRYPSSFELLRSMLNSDSEARTRTVRILSVGCAAGCEPVSIAIAALSAGVAPDRLEVLAVDRNPQAVRDAQQGRWPVHALREGLPDWASRWISASRSDGRIGGTGAAAVDPSVLERIVWRIGDATMESIAEPASCVAVFCRNVLIYLDASAREAMMSRLTSALAPQGTLFLGHAESMVGRAGLESAGVPGAFAWRQSRDTVSAPAPRSSREGAPAARYRSPAAPPSAPAVRRPNLESTAAQDSAPAVDSAHQPVAVARDALARGDTASARRELLRLGDSISRGHHALHADDMELAAGMLCSVGELDAAFALYSRIVFVNPAHDRALLAMAELAETRGRADEAARLRERLRRLATRQAESDRA